MKEKPITLTRFEPGAVTNFAEEIDWIETHFECGELTEARADGLVAQSRARLMGRRLFMSKP